MKRFVRILIICLSAVTMLGGLFACTPNRPSYSGSSSSSRDIVDYYGCPNSKKVRKLNLKRNRK